MEIFDRKTKFLALLATAVVAFGCIEENDGEILGSGADEVAESSEDERPGQPEQEQSEKSVPPVGNTGTSASYSLYGTVCELVQVSCGNGGVFAHTGTQAGILINDRVITKHTFESADGEVLEITEECGSYSAGQDENFGTAHGCRIPGLIEGDAFIVSDNDGWLIEVFRTDTSELTVTNAFDKATNLEDLEDLQSRWDDGVAAFSQEQECGARNLNVESWCSGDSSLY